MGIVVSSPVAGSGVPLSSLTLTLSMKTSLRVPPLVLLAAQTFPR